MNEVELTPTEDLLMEVLAARVRAGESCWTFTRAHHATLQSLEVKGLLHFKTDPTGEAFRAFLTDLGRDTFMSAGYTEPVASLHEQVAELHQQLEVAGATRRAAYERISRTKDENRRLRRQVVVLAGHLGGVTKGTHLEALQWAPEVMVLHEDGSTTTGKLGVAPDCDGYVVGTRPIYPVGDAGLWGPDDGVDVVRPVAL